MAVAVGRLAETQNLLIDYNPETECVEVLRKVNNGLAPLLRTKLATAHELRQGLNEAFGESENE